MKRLSLLSSVLAFGLAVSAPTALAHVGHGDEFQSEGGVNRVEVKAQTDSLLGIQVNPIEPATDGSSVVIIPVSALVEDNGRQLVFVEYENFYEPVDVVTGETQGEFIEILDGLSIGENLVSQGSLSLYAESRKTQTDAVSPEIDATASNETVIQETVAESGAEVSNAATQETDENASNNFLTGLVITVSAGAALVILAVVGIGIGKRKGDA